MLNSSPSIHPLRAGLVAARASLLPGLVVQSIMVAVVLVYYQVASARPFFDRVAEWKMQGGYLFSLVSTMVAGGILPEVLRVVFFQKGRITPQNWDNLKFGLPFWGTQGLCVDLFYRGQAHWFGNDAHVLTILKKVCVDQFLYNPLFAAPFGITIYEWKNRGYRWSRSFLTVEWYRTRIIPGLVATWAVWIPVISFVYCLPETLQIPIFCFALTFWVTIFTLMTEILVDHKRIEF